MATTAAVPPARIQHDVVPALRLLAVGAAAGAVGGLVAGGVLGRLAMRLLTVTSPPGVLGALTDDGARVGEISLSGSLALAAFTTILGATAGLVHLTARRILPADHRRRVLLFAALCGTFGGALAVHDGASFDFSRLAPQWLAVALFVALPAVGGAMIAALVEHWDRPGCPGGWRGSWPVAIGVLAMVPAYFAYVPAIVVVSVVVGVPALRRAWRSRAVTVLGTALFVLAIAWGVYGLVVDVAAIAAGTASTAPLVP